MKHPFKSFFTKIFTVLFLTLPVFLQSCSEPADKFFGVAVLNTNTISDFGTPSLAKQLNGDEAVSVVENKVLYMEKVLKDLNALSANNDSRAEIKKQSIALYEFVIPVYKNEYTAYAKLSDTKAPQEQKDELLKSIEQKYNAEFEKKYTSLLSIGKAFAEDNNLNVNWN